MKTLRATSKRQERRTETEKQILEAAERLLQNQRIGNLTPDILMTEAGLSRTAFYRYFPDMASLVLRLYSDVRSEVDAATSIWELDCGAIEQSLQGIVDIYINHGAILRAVSESSAFDSEIDEAYQQSAQAFIENICSFLKRHRGKTLIAAKDEKETAAALMWMTERYCSRELVNANKNKSSAGVRALSNIWMHAFYGV